jgi:cytochrome c biogenesis protein CcmG/thiol:disulfide interchange protein DsbE
VKKPVPFIPPARVQPSPRRVLARAGTLAALLATLLAPSAWALTAGDAAPDFALQGPAGPVALASLRGKLVYLDFWASWCGPCRQSFPWMNEVQSRWAGRGLTVVGVNVDARSADAQKFLADTPAQFTIAYDPAGDTPRHYGIKGMPTSVLIGPDGKVLWTHSGFRAEDRADLEARLQEALNTSLHNKGQ